MNTDSGPDILMILTIATGYLYCWLLCLTTWPKWVKGNTKSKEGIIRGLIWIFPVSILYWSGTTIWYIFYKVPKMILKWWSSLPDLNENT